MMTRAAPGAETSRHKGGGSGRKPETATLQGSGSAVMIMLRSWVSGVVSLVRLLTVRLGDPNDVPFVKFRQV